MSLAPGTRLGPYEILSALGAGGMGEVYKAHDNRLNRSVAIKVLPTAFVSDPERLARFEREAKAVAALSHPNILAIFDTGVQDTHAYVVTELLDGETLAERLQSGPPPVRKAIEIAVQIARGLAAAHAKGIVHRDLKPANVFLLGDGQVKILDFGLAKAVATDSDTTAAAATDPGSILGTAGYMAPEQVRGQAVDARTDLFAFGAVLYEMLTGQRAFKRDTAAETLTAILNDDPPEITGSRPDLSPALERIVRHCLEKNPAERFQSARDVAFALEAFSGSPTSSAAQSAPGESVQGKTGRRGIAAAAIVLIGTALVGAGVVIHRRAAVTVPPAPTFTTRTFQRQAIYNARFMPDGKTIVYSAPLQGSVPDIYELRADTVEPRLIVAGTDMYSVSSSGELAVQTAGSLAAGKITGTLARMSVGGAPRAVLEQVSDADWGPDGSLAVIHYVAGKYRLEYPIGTTLYETTDSLGGTINSNGNIRVSPDGGRVAFFEQPVGRDCLVKVVDRSARVTTLARQAQCSGLAWAPGGTTIVFSSTDGGTSLELQMHSAAADAESPVQNLPQSAGGLQVTDVAPNGTVLAIRTELRSSVVAMLPGATAERDMSWLNMSSGPLLSADGAALLFTDDRAAASSGPFTLLRRADGGPPQRLGEGAGLGLSPDGKWALALVSKAGLSHLVLYATGPGEPIVLPKGPIEQLVGGAWFPDGHRVLVCGFEPKHVLRCYSQDIAGGAPKPVTPDGAVVLAPPSPDGLRLLAQASDGVRELITLGSGQAATVPGLRPDDLVAGWSTDGRAIFVTGFFAVPARLERVDLVTGGRSLIKEVAPADRTGVTLIVMGSVMGDGREYAYTYLRSLSTLYQIDGLNLARAP